MYVLDCDNIHVDIPTNKEESRNSIVLRHPLRFILCTELHEYFISWETNSESLCVLGPKD